MSYKLKRVLVTLVFGLVIAVAVIGGRWNPEGNILHQLCDGFFVAGVLLLGMGGLKVARNAGTFDMMVYGMDAALRITLPWVMKEKKDADFVAYKERKQEERKPAYDLLIAGGIHMALAMIFLVLYTVTKS